MVLPETCHYCGNQYHPMPRYTPKVAVFGRKSLIYVCHGRYCEATGKWEPTDCRQKAEAEGYVFRPDLTPKR